MVTLDEYRFAKLGLAHLRMEAEKVELKRIVLNARKEAIQEMQAEFEVIIKQFEEEIRINVS